jgi:hypothetical protein
MPRGEDMHLLHSISIMLSLLSLRSDPKLPLRFSLKLLLKLPLRLSLKLPLLYKNNKRRFGKAFRKGVSERRFGRGGTSERGVSDVAVQVKEVFRTWRYK